MPPTDPITRLTRQLATAMGLLALAEPASNVADDESDPMPFAQRWREARAQLRADVRNNPTPAPPTESTQ